MNGTTLCSCRRIIGFIEFIYLVKVVGILGTYLANRRSNNVGSVPRLHFHLLDQVVPLVQWILATRALDDPCVIPGYSRVENGYLLPPWIQDFIREDLHRLSVDDALGSKVLLK